MQADARRTLNERIKSPCEPGFVAPPVIRAHRRSPANLLARPASPRFKFFARLPQTQGWAMKAHEFIDSGPPALLNNPCCCRRVVCCFFLKRVMEVQYG